MILVNFYGLMPNKRIQTDNIPIFRTTEDLLLSMKNTFNNIEKLEDKTLSFSFPIELLRNEEIRMRIFGSIPSMITNKEVKEELTKHSNQFQLKTYLILPNGKVNIIKDYNKIFDNLDKIEEMCVNSLKENDTKKIETFEQFRDRMLQIKSNASTVKDIMISTTGLAYIYELIDEFIENHRVDLQNRMVANIKEIREEQEENEELETELDMINKHAKTVLKDNVDDKFLQCIYNGEEISQLEMLDKLSSHMIYKEDVDDSNIFIGDTLEDEYRIETERLIITRAIGGKIRISVK